MERIISIKDNSSRWTLEIGKAQSTIPDDFFAIHYDSAWKVLIVGFSDLGDTFLCLHKCSITKFLLVSLVKNFGIWILYRRLSISNSYPDDFIRDGGCDEQTAVLALTHDPLDDLF